MKKFFVVMLFAFLFIQFQGQTDLEIAKLLIGKNISTVDTILNEFELEYFVTYQDKNEMELYIVKNNSIRVWNIKYSDIYTFADKSRKVKNMFGEKLIYEIFVRYRHSNMNDLKEFHTYEVPESTKYVTYDKKLGRNISHLRLTHERYVAIIDTY